MAEKKNNNKSLFLYTGLIFFAAAILIIMSFFMQRNIEKNEPPLEATPAAQEEQLSGIAGRAAALSEENKTLFEENKALKEQVASLEETEEINSLLLSAHGYYSVGNTEKAAEILAKLDYESLTPDQKIIYDIIMG